MTSKLFSLVYAASQNHVIGAKGALPWSLKRDMQHFKALTTETNQFRQNAVIMGRKTFESLPPAFRPLPDRINIVISQASAKSLHDNLENQGQAEQVFIAPSLEESLQLIEHDLVSRRNIDKVFVIGGSKLFTEAVSHKHCLQVYKTNIGIDFEGDVRLPQDFLKEYIPIEISRTLSEKGVPYQFERHVKRKFYDYHMLLTKKHERDERNFFSLFSEKKTTLIETDANQQDKELDDKLSEYQSSFIKKYRENHKIIEDAMQKKLYPQHQELQYLDILKNIIAKGTKKMDRTNTGTLSLFGGLMRFDLSETFPLLTTKDVFWRGVCEELLWFLAGKTNSQLLSEKKVKIWDPNGSREFLDSLGFANREVGDLGPVYGFQWRHFGAQYKDMHTDYTGQGVDQITDLIKQIKDNPQSRRLIISAWNPADLKKMALPPCHVLAQFEVSEGKLNCLLYQRSCDMGLGIPFNIASYSLLTCILAQICGLKRGEFVHTLGDMHIYSNHLDQLQNQINRSPGTFPILKLNPNVKNIEDFKFEDFELIGYNPQSKIKMKMAV